ncbi:MAG: epoxyqueuosine reductase QueH [Eubacteriales bacterium]|nr:epoxyqueuosine reductase QueH [Eubacteriales bacterium]
MKQRNYQKELDKIILHLTEGEQPPTLLLHSCCAPCSSYVIEYLSQYFHITVFYYNPNIAPEEEYHKRVREQQRFIRELPTRYPVEFIEGDFDAPMYYEKVRGLEREPEGGARCEICFRMRLKRSAELAKELGMDYVTTTLTISPLKNAQLLNQIGEELAGEYQVRWLPSDFKKRNGYKRSTELSREYGLYRQNYCGCIFSRREAEEREDINKEEKQAD